MPKILFKRGSRAQLDAAATAGTLNQGEPYLITDEGRVAVGLTSSTYIDFAKLAEAGGSVAADVFDVTLDFGTGDTFKSVDVSFPAMTATKVIQAFFSNKQEEVAVLGMTCGESARNPGTGFSIFGFTQLRAIGAYNVKVIVSGA